MKIKISNIYTESGKLKVIKGQSHQLLKKENKQKILKKIENQELTNYQVWGV